MSKLFKSIARPAALILGALAFAALTVNALRSGQGPNPVSDIGAWTDWAGRDPVNALVMMVSALLAGFGAWGTVSGLVNPNASREDLSQQSDATRQAVTAQGDASATRDAQMAEHIRRLEAKIEAMGVQGAGASTGSGAMEGRGPGLAETLASVAASTSPEMAPARDAIRREDPRAVVEALMQTQGPERVQRLREAGKLASAFDVDLAETAYRAAHALEPSARAMAELADVLFARGDLAGAQALLDEAAEVGDDPAARAKALLARVYYDVNWAQTMDGAAERVRKAEALLDQAGDSKEAQDERLWSRIVAGDLALEIKDREAALAAYRSAIILQTAEADTGLEMNVAHAFLGHDRITNLLTQEGGMAEAQQSAVDALIFAEALTRRDPTRDRWQAYLAHAHARRGFVEWNLERPSVALEHYSRAVDRWRALYQHNPSSKERLWELLDALENQALLLLNADRTDEAVARTVEIADLAEQLPTSGPGGGRLGSAATSLTKLGRRHYHAKAYDAAIASLQAAFTARTRLLDAGQLNDNGRVALVDVALMLMDTLRMKSRTADALAVAARAVEVNEGLLLRRADDADRLLDAVRLHGMRGEAYDGVKLYQESIEAYGRARTAADALLQITPDNAEVARVRDAAIEGANAARGKLKP